MRPLDWLVMFGWLAFIVSYGLYRGRGSTTVNKYLLAGKTMPWYAMGLSIMATQASAITFIATTGQAFVDGIAGFNRPTNVKFGPDGCAYVVDYGAVRDFGQSDPDAKFITAGDGPLVQIPHTGVIWKICAE